MEEGKIKKNKNKTETRKKNVNNINKTCFNVGMYNKRRKFSVKVYKTSTFFFQSQYKDLIG